MQKGIKKLSFFSDEDFYNNAIRYINAIKKRQMFCIIYSVSNSGMSRNLAFFEASKGKQQTNFLNFFAFFKALGHTEAKEGFRINGCGMDMVFATNYNNIHLLHNLGFINKKQCTDLAQNTPNTF